MLTINGDLDFWQPRHNMLTQKCLQEYCFVFQKEYIYALKAVIAYSWLLLLTECSRYLEDKQPKILISSICT